MLEDMEGGGLDDLDDLLDDLNMGSANNNNRKQSQAGTKTYALSQNRQNDQSMGGSLK